MRTSGHAMRAASSIACQAVDATRDAAVDTLRETVERPADGGRNGGRNGRDAGLVDTQESVPPAPKVNPALLATADPDAMVIKRVRVPRMTGRTLGRYTL